MVAFAERFGFTFVAHAVGDANRSARVEGPFGYVEGNFIPGRQFKDIDDVCAQAREWVLRDNAKFKRTLQAKHIELFQLERLALVPLPEYVPEPYALHSRAVDLSGYINLYTNRYSVPPAHVGRPVQVRETKDKIFVIRGHDVIAEHDRLENGARQRIKKPEHRPPDRRPHRGAETPPTQEELVLRASRPEFGTLIDALRRGHGGRCVALVKRLHRMFLEYPTEALASAIAQALVYGLVDLARIERMALRGIAGAIFKLPMDSEDSHE
jgi:hypothetical protein